jgi:hypothetical protein
MMTLNINNNINNIIKNLTSLVFFQIGIGPIINIPLVCVLQKYNNNDQPKCKV